jgi:uncharacterized protein (DUF1919 family)
MVLHKKQLIFPEGKQKVLAHSVRAGNLIKCIIVNFNNKQPKKEIINKWHIKTRRENMSEEP